MECHNTSPWFIIDHMPRLFSLLVIAALTGSFLGFSPFQTRPGSETPGAQNGYSYAPGILIVGLASAGKNFQIAALEQSLQAQQVAALSQIDAIILHVPPGQEQQAASLAKQNPAVAFAEPDYIITADSGSSSGRIPDDPFYDQQWSLQKIGVSIAWEVTTGLPDVLIAVVDSGVQLDHPDLADKIWTNPGEIPGNQLDDDGKGKVDDVHGWHFYHQDTNLGFVPAEDANVSDDFGHGTHVAGIVAASTNNQTGISGISWNSRIMPVKVLDQYGSGFYSDIAAGIIYAADNGAKIINLSLGGVQPSELLRSAVDYAHNHGALVIAAAGNSGAAVLYPAAYDPALAVAATDKNDQRPAFSNFGPQVDLAAPGTNIYSTWYRSNYFTKSGTSMATPHVAGVAALLWSYNPSLTADEIARILMHSAVDIEPAGVDIYTGWGRLSAARAVDYLVRSTMFLPVISRH